MKLRIKLSVLCVLLASRLVWASAVDTSALPAGTKWLIHLDLAQAAESGLGQAICQQVITDKIVRHAQAMKAMTSVDLLEGIWGLTLSGGTEKHDILLLVQGRFEPDRFLIILAASEGYEETQYQGRKIAHWKVEMKAAEWPTGEVRIRNLYLTFPRENLAVLAVDEAYLKQVLDIFAGQAQSLQATGAFPDLAALGQANFLVCAGRDLKTVKGFKPLAQMPRRVDGFRALIGQVGDQIKATITATTDSAESARRIEDVLRGLLALIELNTEGCDECAELFASCNLTRAEKAMCLEMSYSAEKLKNHVVKVWNLVSAEMLKD